MFSGNLGGCTDNTAGSTGWDCKSACQGAGGQACMSLDPIPYCGFCHDEAGECIEASTSGGQENCAAW